MVSERLAAAGIAVAVFVGVCALFVPWPQQVQPGASNTAPRNMLRTISDTKESDKKCDPACKSPEVCVDGTCSLPACAPDDFRHDLRPAPPPYLREWDEPHSALADVWVAGSLR